MRVYFNTSYKDSGFVYFNLSYLFNMKVRDIRKIKYIIPAQHVIIPLLVVYGFPFQSSIASVSLLYIYFPN